MEFLYNLAILFLVFLGIGFVAWILFLSAYNRRMSRYQFRGDGIHAVSAHNIKIENNKWFSNSKVESFKIKLNPS